ncbi:eukaryotic aspartyl protease domain-containing protein [Ditylenchus destructor]|uniref:Eukaryotic aspartyl protease domain-containing protein n=1 Tax=Ditylenchus destructor TaxID=166010 RepID=A0AAD4NHY8_9BILA|nr:eukaryotic aspartyl protease domain-containing protein [Ditylenchus destructor]
MTLIDFIPQNSNRRSDADKRKIMTDAIEENISGFKLYCIQRNAGSPNSRNRIIRDYFDLEYIANIMIGTPEQSFLVAIDNGSTNLWVTDVGCNETGACNDKCGQDEMYCAEKCDKFCCRGNLNASESICARKQKFNSNASSTCCTDGRSFDIEYGYGFAEGFLGSDTVRFGGVGTNQLIISSITFGQVTALSSDWVDDSADGLLGLAYTSIAVDGVTPPLVNAVNQGLVDKPMFTVFLNTEGAALRKEGGGVFTWGGLDTVNCGQVIDYVNLTSESFYEFAIEGVHVGTKYKH